MITLAWRDVVMGVRGGRAEILAWLDGFLCPPFTRDGTPSRWVDVAVDGLPEGEAGEAVTALTLDERLVTLRTAGGWAIDDELGLALRRTASGAALRLAGDTRLARIGVMRVVRELAAAHALARGDAPLHGAAVATGAGALLFVGPKQSGKTTLLLYALAQPGVRLLANDRLFVDAGGVARGMPTIVAPRPGTLELFPAAAARLAAAPSPLGPGGLAAALGVELVAAAPVARLLLVARGATTTLRPLDADEAERRLARDGLIARGLQATLLAPPVDIAPAVAALARRVPCAELIVGPDALGGPELWRSLA